jgi:hypothetical protein
MKNKFLLPKLTSGLIFIVLFLMLASACWGTHSFDLKIENKKEQTLTIVVNDYQVGDVKPGQQITRNDESWDTGVYLVTAKNNSGDLLYSKEYKLSELKKADYKVIITD